MIKNPKIEFIKSCRNKDQLIIDNKYIDNFASEDKKGNNNKLKYEDYHNHEISNIKDTAAKAESEIKKIINEDNPFALKGKTIYNEKTKYLGLLVPEYNSLKATINRHKYIFS